MLFVASYGHISKKIRTNKTNQAGVDHAMALLVGGHVALQHLDIGAGVERSRGGRVVGVVDGLMHPQRDYSAQIQKSAQ